MKKVIVTFGCVLGIAICGFSQQAVLHENAVRPHLTEEYHAAVGKLKDICIQNNVNMTWRTIVFDDNSYAHLLPVEGNASTSTPLWTDLKSKIGNEAFDKLAAGIGASVESQIQGTTNFLPEYSYMDPAEDELYRAILFVFPQEGKWSEMEALFLDWKKAYELKKASSNYHVYKILYGPDEGFIFSLSARNGAHMEEKSNETHRQLGDVERELWNRQLKLTKRYFWKRGYVAPGLSYSN